VKPGRSGAPAEILEQVAAEQGESLAGLSRFVGRRDGYLQSFISRGVPATLPKDVRDRLTKYLRLDPWDLGSDERF
jgi:hypothetical protein